MHPQFFEILEKACSLFANVVLLTNGSLMTKAILDRLHEYNVTSVNISIHGNQYIHDDLTQTQGSYERSISAIKYFLNKQKILVASNYVLNAANIENLKNTIHDFQKIGLDFMTITRFIPVGIGKEAHYLKLDTQQLVDSFRIVHEHYLSGNRPHIEFAEATPFCSLPLELRYLANSCSYGYDRFYVDINGELLVCGLSRIKLGGNILQQTINEIKRISPVFQAFINNEHIPLDCNMCNNLDNCHGGCRAAALENGDWKGTYDPHAKIDQISSERIIHE